MNNPIGIMVDSLRLGLRDGIRKARELGAQGVQLYAVEGETAPENLTREKRRELKALLDDNGLVVSALCADLGGHGFAIAEDNPRRVERSKRILDLARELGAQVATTHLGVVPEEETPAYHAMQSACRTLGGFAQSMDGWFAIETGPEKASTLRRFLDSLGCGGVGVNLDPANLVMVTADDPVAAVFTLKDYIVHTHAKDGRMLQQTDPTVIYRFFAEGGIGDLRLSDYFLETPLGDGNVDFPAYLKALEEIGYRGYLTVEREVGEHPEQDIAQAVRFLRECQGRL